MKRHSYLLPLALALACPASVRAQPLVVTGNSILKALTQEVAGSLVRVESIVPRGESSITFEPAEEHALLLAEARLLIVNGAGYEPWLADLEKSANYDGPVVTTTDRVPLYDMDGGFHDVLPEDPNQAPVFAVAVEYDPHAWLDPRNVVIYVENIRNGLTDLVTGEARTAMEERAANLIREIRELHGFAESRFAGIAPADKVLVTPHDTLRYFANAYGFKVTPIVGLASGRELQPAQESRMIQTILSLNPLAVFFETTANQRQVRRLATETNARIVTSLLTTDVGPEGSPTSTYPGMFRANVNLIADSLRDPNAPTPAAPATKAATPATPAAPAKAAPAPASQ